jgi:hypothetical protein
MKVEGERAGEMQRALVAPRAGGGPQHNRMSRTALLARPIRACSGRHAMEVEGGLDQSGVHEALRAATFVALDSAAMRRS